MSTILGQINEFDSATETFVEWTERLEQSTEAERKRPILLSNIDAKGYKLIRKLSQNEPAKKTYDELRS